jgi:hypothetical protein
MCSWAMVTNPSVRPLRRAPAVEALLAAGLTQAEIALRLGRAKSTIAYHMRGLGMPIDERCNRRYDWSHIQAF